VMSENWALSLPYSWDLRNVASSKWPAKTGGGAVFE
jgi:hypothetical protein